MRRALEIDVRWRPRSRWISLPEIERSARAVSRAEGFSKGTLSITVVGAAAMSRIHREFLDKPGPTDAITFDLGSARREKRLLGEIVVCADVARRAAGRSAPLPRRRGELMLYVVHGILHLAGYDDHTAAGFARMHAREDELLTQLGYGPVFSLGAGGR